MAKRIIKKIFNLSGIDIKRYDKAYEKYARLYDRYRQYTMIPRETFIQNLYLCNTYKDTPGDYVECGVWRGGMSAAIAEVLGKEKKIHLFDSFEGLPQAKEIDGREALEWQKNTDSSGYFNNCSADVEFTIAAMNLARHENYHIHKGWFDKTLPESIRESISILRLDGDWYESIMTCLDHLFPRVKDGGIVLLDDYYTWEGCSKAVHDYLSKSKNPSRVHQWNNQIAFIIVKN